MHTGDRVGYEMQEHAKAERNHCVCASVTLSCSTQSLPRSVRRKQTHMHSLRH